MSKLNPVLEKMFAIFELIVSFLIINLLIVVLSIVSLFLLYPVLISGIFYILRRIIKFKEYDSLLINYFTFVKKNIVSSLLAGILPMTLSFVIVLTVIFVNPLMIDIINDSYIVVIQIVQLIMLYILLKGETLHSLFHIPVTKSDSSSNITPNNFVGFDN